MSKPIFVCYLPFRDEEHISIVRTNLEKELINDYHILVISSTSYEDIKFELFNSELEEKDFEDLKIRLNIKD